jgi:hypothetical protein
MTVKIYPAEGFGAHFRSVVALRDDVDDIRNIAETASGGGIAEAPSDGNTYARKNGDWESFEAGAGLPSGWSYTKYNVDSLDLEYNNELVARFNREETWFPTSIRTGVGSLHLGSLHSMGSAGENVTWVNEDSSICWFPSWSGLPKNGGPQIPMTSRVHAEDLLTVEPVGALGSADVPFENSTFTSVSDAAFFKLTVRAGEDYSGFLTMSVIKSTGKEVASFSTLVDASEGDDITLEFSYPLWMLQGQVFNTTVTKGDGTPFIVKAEVSGVNPWRRAFYKTFVDHEVLHRGNPSQLSATINGLTGDERIPWGALKDVPEASASTAGVIKVGSTLTVDEEGKLQSNVSGAIKVAVADETAMLALPPKTNEMYIVTRTDENRLYYLSANKNPSTLSEWEAGALTTDTVVSFNGRDGAIVAKEGDYTLEQCPTVDLTSGTNYRLVIDDGVLYMEEV